MNQTDSASALPTDSGTEATAFIQIPVAKLHGRKFEKLEPTVFDQDTISTRQDDSNRFPSPSSLLLPNKEDARSYVNTILLLAKGHS